MPLRMAFAAPCCLFVCLVSAAPAAGQRPGDSSWGKPGISFEQYRADAIDCARSAAEMDVADTKAARTLVTATRELDRIADTLSIEAGAAPTDSSQPGTIAAAGAYKHAMEKYRPREQFDAIRDLQYSALDRCLESRGYVRFRLTRTQAKQLRRLKPGSLERRAFLHKLGSDPQVLARQKL